MRTPFIILLSILLSACSGPARNPLSNYLQKSEVAIDEEKWEVAYRFLEDGLTSPIVETKEKAISLYKNNPKLRVAAAQTFSKESLQKTIFEYGFSTGVAIERNRLRMYSVVASDAEIKLAIDNLQLQIDQHADEMARALAQASAAKEKVEADAAARKAKEDAAAQDAAAKEEREKAETIKLNADFEKSKAKAFYRCRDRLECEKAFSLTQIFIATNTDMKIQMANDTIIETYNPNKVAAMGATAFKIPKEGTSAEIRLIVSCETKDLEIAEKSCKTRSIEINTNFPRFLKERLAN